ncbi:MAG TPA: hypothetical protein VKA89_11295 [Solirubrobacterales bacterium]|nr:hypothetical protein [Solirubrobacterales bacterium]
MRHFAGIALAAIALVAPSAAPAGETISTGAVPRLQCEQPRRLHLERYEDGSARLLCGTRLLARVGVPW